MQQGKNYLIDIAHKHRDAFHPVKVPLHVIKSRRDRLAQMIGQHHYLPVRRLCEELGVSEATVRRDLAELHREKRITRTFGGALSDFNARFPSFRERRARAGKSKARIARAALSFIKPDSTCFFDSGTTVFAIAEAFAATPITPVRIVTCNIPVGELLASIPNVEVYQLAGQLLYRQSVLLGDTAKRSLEFWRFDAAFLSAEGMNAEGLWNSQAVIVEQQRVLLNRTHRAIFCMDKSKLGCQAPHFLANWNRVDLLLTDASIENLKKAGIDLPDDHCISISGGAKHSPALEEESRETAPTDENFPVHYL